jgi:hypothetical protein
LKAAPGLNPVVFTDGLLSRTIPFDAARHPGQCGEWVGRAQGGAGEPVGGVLNVEFFCIMQT